MTDEVRELLATMACSIETDLRDLSPFAQSVASTDPMHRDRLTSIAEHAAALAAELNRLNVDLIE